MPEIFSDVKFQYLPLCFSKGLALPVGPCSPGYYCTGRATQARPTDGETGSICPPGTYCGKDLGAGVYISIDKFPRKF